MTLNEFLDWMDDVRPSPWSHEQKAVWVNDLESSLWSRMLLAPPGVWRTKTAAKDGDAPLLLPDGWRKLYAAYVGAMMDYAAGENAAYGNSMALYNGYLAEFGAWYAEEFDPAKRGPAWLSMPAVAASALEEAVYLGNLPAGAGVLGAELRITEAFDGTGELCLTSGAGELMAVFDPSSTGTQKQLSLTLPMESGSVYLLHTGGDCTVGTAAVRLLIQPAAGCRTTLTVAAAQSGASGAPGRDGKDGADGKDGEDGADGADGKSAYAYAQEGGYTGTEAEFAAKLAAEIPAELVLYTPQSLTTAQKTQARENIGIYDETYVESESLEVVLVANDHNGTGSGIDKRDYTYTEQNIATHGYPSYAGTVAKPGSLAGGVLRVEWDTEELGDGALQISLFLFDADGNPYKHTGYGDGAGAAYFGDGDVGFTGELYEPTYVDPAPEDNPAIVNAGYSYGSLLGPFTTQIPEGCTVMPFVRCVSYPCGNFADRIALGQWLMAGGISFTVEKTYDKSESYLTKNMGEENANGYLVTDSTGKVTVKAAEAVIPDYWQSHLEEKAETIRALQKAGGKDCFSFAVITDLHYSENKGKLSPLLAGYLMDACDIKYLLCLGDMQTQAAVTDESVLHTEWEGIRAMFAPVADRTLMTLGNHDGAWGQMDSDSDGAVDKYYGQNLAPETLYEYCFRPVGRVPGVTFDAGGKGYYVDDPASHVRYILLNAFANDYAENDDGTAVNNYMTVQRFTQSQFDMVTEALATVPSDAWSVVVGCHVPLISDFGDNYVGDRDLMMYLLVAYHNRSIAAGNYGTEGEWDYVTVNRDFADAKGSVAGVFAGHLHADDSNTAWAFPVVLTDCDCEPSGDETHEAGTVTEQSFDVFTVNRATGVIHATKIGYGSDRTISK